MEEQVDKELLSRAISTAFAACHTGNVAGARAVFEKLLAYKPDMLGARIGEAFTYLVVDDFAKGDELLAAMPDDDDDVVAMRVLSFCLQKRVDEASKLFDELVDSNQPSAKLASEFLKVAKEQA